MIYADDFRVEKSWLIEGNFYIEYRDISSITALSEITRIKAEKIEKIFTKNNGVYSQENGIYYFSDYNDAENAMKQLLEHVKTARKTRTINLTDKEIEYIRKALVNENSNIIHVDNRIKDEIFRKLNK